MIGWTTFIHPTFSGSAVALESVKQPLLRHWVQFWKSGDNSVPCFFFQRNDIRLNDPTSLWCTVAFDLAHFDSALLHSITKVLEERRIDPERADIKLQFEHLIKGPLQKNCNRWVTPPVVLIDALDECGFNSSDSQQHQIFLDTLTQWSGLPSVFKLIVTSRYEQVPKSFGEVCHHIELQSGVVVSSDTYDITLRGVLLIF